MSMKNLIAAFPSNITEALEIASKVTVSKSEVEIKNILICGMGGSGIGGKLVAKWVEDEINVPVAFTSDYGIPGFVSKHTLVIGSSYSGNTEETLSSFRAAIDKGARLIGVCSGGKMKEICESNNFDVIVVPGGNPPRTALAYSIVQLLHVFSQLGLTSSERLDEVEKARQLIVSDENEINEIATSLASFLKGNVGIIYGTTSYEPVLVRARQQFNENSKLLCWHHSLPEMNHNELVGWGGGDERFATVFIETEDIHRRNKKRMDISRDVISKKSNKVFDLFAKGNSRIERSIYLINVVDWASLYLSEMKDVDPIDIEVIDYLKDTLSKFE